MTMLDTDKKQPLPRARWLAGLTVGALTLSSAAHAETLQEALAKAYENNPTLTAARAGQRANDENVPIQKSGGLPDVGVGVDYQENLVLPGNSFFSPKRFVSVGGQLSVPIYQGGAVRNAVKAAKFRVEAGQADLRGRQDRLQESLQQIYARLGDDQRLVLEYKFFEPAFYHTDVPDCGTSYAQVASLGDKAMVCLDTGHHAPGTNIEFIVMQLLRLGKLGSFDFNSRFYADDDLIVGAVDPFQLFRILFEVVRGGGLNNPDVAFMLDQCHNVEDKIPGQIRSVLNVQEMTARALIVDREALAAAQKSGDVLAANAVFMDAFYTDVRPALAEWRESRGLAADPMKAYAESGYQQKIAAERVGGVQAGWGA